MFKAFTDGITNFGLTLLDSVSKKSPDIHDAFRAGQEHMLNRVMEKLLGYDNWWKARIKHKEHLETINNATADHAGSNP